MQLYKTRGFGDFFQDTFTFLKLNGKHIFKHYFIINGFFLMALLVIGYFFTKFYTEAFFSGFLNNGNSTRIESYINDNVGLFIVLAFLFIVVALIAGVISFSYIPLYLKLYIKNQNTDFGTSEIVAEYKSNSGRIFIFLACGFLLGIPLAIAMGIMAFILVITIIGILTLPILIGAFSLYYNMTLMEYLEEKKGIWDSFSYSWTLLSSKFWPATMSVGLFFLISYIFQNVLTLIPYMFGMASLFTTIESGSTNPQDVGATMTVILLGIFFLSFVVSAFLGLIIQLNQGVVFYSLKEDNENINTISVIDEIGSGE